jgi:hypothetical protein
MEVLVKLFSAGLLVWLALFALLLILRILRRDIAVAGMLQHDLGDDSPSVVPERVVAMATFPFVLGVYALHALQADVSGAHPSLPDVPQSLMALLTGGNGLYLAGKIARNT